MPTVILTTLVTVFGPAILTGTIGTIVVAGAGLAVSLAIGAAASAVAGLFAPSQQSTRPSAPAVPKPEDGKFNLKQSVPALSYVLGTVKKGGDYVFLAETGGTAYNIIVDAGHRIEGYVSHWLHDEQVTLNGSGVVTSPSHFGSNVAIEERLGLDQETAYAPVVAAFSEVWTTDHRGDGLASVMVSSKTVAQENYQSVYPQQMPQITSIIQGALLYDPRTETEAFSSNIALFALWHLTNPVGGKLSRDDLYMPDWAHAANVCDEQVTNRDGDPETRYQGGFWFRADNDPIGIARLIAQAGEMAIYERADGNIGVHAGEFVEPTIRLIEPELHLVNFDANRRKRSNVLAVRGRYTGVDEGYNTVDAVTYGNPYGTDDERTRTLENQIVQSHNHIARLMKITFARANAPKVDIVATYQAAKHVRFSRFVRVHYPPKLDEAVIEIVGRPKISLRDMTVSFSGIVVPETLCSFDALTEEGAPGNSIAAIVGSGVPEPINFNVTIETEIVGGGATSAYVAATWDHLSDALTYELEWVPSAGGVPESVTSIAGNDTVRSAYLADGVEYDFRLCTWSNGGFSAWTDYATLTATANPTAPNDVTNVAATGGAGEVSITWDAPSDVNYYGAKVFTHSADDFNAATQDGAPEYGAADSRTVTGLAAGDHFGWVQPINSSGVVGNPIATGLFTVS